MPELLDESSRYPGGDPENGPRCRHVWDGERWIEASDPWEPPFTGPFDGFHQWDDHPGSFEVFHQDYGPRAPQCAGFYWWPCFPGCLPDGDPTGPFPTAEGAYLDAIGE